MLYNMILCRRMYSTLKVSQSEVAKHFFGGCPEVKTYSSNDCYNGWWFEHVFLCSISYMGIIYHPN